MFSLGEDDTASSRELDGADDFIEVVTDNQRVPHQGFVLAESRERKAGIYADGKRHGDDWQRSLVTTR